MENIAAAACDRNLAFAAARGCKSTVAPTSNVKAFRTFGRSRALRCYRTGKKLAERQGRDVTRRHTRKPILNHYRLDSAASHNTHVAPMETLVADHAANFVHGAAQSMQGTVMYMP